MNLTNDTILITGGTSGIGLDWATRLLAMGRPVIITGRDQAKLDQTRKNLRAFTRIKATCANPQPSNNCTSRLRRHFHR